MLTESNEKALDMVCQNEELNYSPSFQKLEQVECYADIIFYLKHGTCPNPCASWEKIINIKSF